MNKADNRVKIYACRKATNNSMVSINTTNTIDTGETQSVLKINMSDIKLKIRMWPAVMLANKRIIKAIGLVNIPTISTGIIMKNNHHGFGTNMCFQ